LEFRLELDDELDDELIPLGVFAGHKGSALAFVLVESSDETPFE
jgi:hypothetical protein